MVVTVRGVWHAGLERSNVTRLLRSGAAFVLRRAARIRLRSADVVAGLELQHRLLGRKVDPETTTAALGISTTGACTKNGRKFTKPSL